MPAPPGLIEAARTRMVGDAFAIERCLKARSRGFKIVFTPQGI
ncbi:hypothetical protein SAOR_04080 [Salinisphaera orenii MK-B5]|uniref:Uncharacterized protein n=1 Tax=Salinisphaera orenii MK-B5 TaxID=856730 RepID=A0A423PUM2_9GAMM|nr:hypothetical protein SAOR_04080 [Salinisphaera orenii MK-B5]